MTLMYYVLLAPVLMLALYIIGIQYFRGGLWKLVALFTISAFLLDVLLNFTLFALLLWRWPTSYFSLSDAILAFMKTSTWRWPRYDYTFSKTLGTLYNGTGWRTNIAFFVGQKILDPFDPRGQHVYPAAK
jgi:hypothetical protein